MLVCQVMSVLFLLPWAIVSGEIASVRSSSRLYTWGFWFIMTEAALLGFLLNLAYFVLIKHGSPLTTHIANCTKAALQATLWRWAWGVGDGARGMEVRGFCVLGWCLLFVSRAVASLAAVGHV